LKKQLLCTSAIALGVAAAPAMAQEWNLDWGGFYNADVLYNSTSGNNIPAAQDLDGININNNAEIVFTPSVTLDNGMTFGVNIQLEGQTAGDQMDETYMYVESDTMGRIEVGNTNSAGYKLSVGAPSVGFGINSPSPSAFHPTAFSPVATGFGLTAFGSSATEVNGNNDIPRISYFSPSFNGLTLGVSYAPGQAQDTNGLVNRNGGLNDVFDIGVNYSQTFGNVDVEVGARWGTGDAGTVFATTAGTPAAPGPDGILGTADDIPAIPPTVVLNAGPDGIPGTADDVVRPAVTQPGDPETWAVGARIGVAGFTFGGSYAENTTGAAFGIGDNEGWSLGVTYDLAGPWTVGFDTYQGEATVATIASGAGANVKDEYEAYQVGAERELGNGVAWRIYAIQSETSRSTSANVIPNKFSAESTTVGTGIRLNF